MTSAAMSAADQAVLAKLRPPCLAKLSASLAKHNGRTTFATPAAQTAFLSAFEGAIAERAASVAAYREKIMFYSANFGGIAEDLAGLDPATLAEMKHRDVVSNDFKTKMEAERKQRASEVELEEENTVNVMCAACGLPVMSRMNNNRFDIDDETLGNQYENNYNNFCECDADVDPMDKYGDTSDEDEHDDGSHGNGVAATGSAIAPQQLLQSSPNGSVPRKKARTEHN
jgi:hypothetical protein